MKLRKVTPIAAVLPALIAISACSGESTDPGKKDAKVSANSTPLEDKSTADAEAERVGAMAPQALEKATLSGKRTASRPRR